MENKIDRRIHLESGFTDRFFEFPIRIYERASATPPLTYGSSEVNEEEEEEQGQDPYVPQWVIGYARVYRKELKHLHWYDGFSEGRTVEQVAKEGFDLTMIFSSEHGSFTCAWNRGKFERKLNEFMSKQQCYGSS